MVGSLYVETGCFIQSISASSVNTVEYRKISKIFNGHEGTESAEWKVLLSELTHTQTHSDAGVPLQVELTT